MNKYLTITFAIALALAMETSPLAETVKNSAPSSTNGPAEPVDDLMGAPEVGLDMGFPDLDFGEPLPDAFEDLGAPASAAPAAGSGTDPVDDAVLPDETVAADAPTGPDYSALPDEALVPLKELGAQFLKALQDNDPAELASFPPSIVDKVDAIIADPSSLTPAETAALMQHILVLGREGYAINMAPSLPAFEMPATLPPVFEPPVFEPPVFEPPVFEPLIVEPIDPFVPDFDPPIFSEPSYAEPIYRDADDYYVEGALTATPFARVGEGEALDFPFGHFFSLPYEVGKSFQVLRVEVDKAGLLAPRFLYDSAQFGSLGISLYQSERIASALIAGDQIAVAPGSYDLVVGRNQVEAEVNVTVRIDFREARDTTEPNNTKEQAIPITLPFRRALFLESSGDVDWLTFSVEEEGVLSVAGINAGVRVATSDGTYLPVSSSTSGARYAIIPPGTYFARVEGTREARIGKVTLRFYPPSGIAAEINRIIGVGLENNEEVSVQMRAVSWATGAPLIETTDAAKITEALEEASTVDDGWSWWWVLLIVAAIGGGCAVFFRFGRPAGV